MTQAARITSTSTSEAERARQVEEAVHSVHMAGLDLAPEDAADAADYVAGTITLDEYGSRTRARYGVPEEWGGGSGDPVAAFDAMWEAGTSLFGSYVWLADHADNEQTRDRWWTLALDVKREREQVDAVDMEVQRVALAGFVSRERAVRGLVRV